jgi:hypothetical protein
MTERFIGVQQLIKFEPMRDQEFRIDFLGLNRLSGSEQRWASRD